MYKHISKHIGQLYTYQQYASLSPPNKQDIIDAVQYLYQYYQQGHISQDSFEYLMKCLLSNYTNSLAHSKLTSFTEVFSNTVHNLVGSDAVSR